MHLDLAGIWTLTSADGAHTAPQYTAPMPLPGDSVSALHAAGILPDPYWGTNELKCRWPADRDWVAAREFSLPDEPPGEGWYLDVEGLDTVADVRINDTLVLAAKNCFRRYRPDVSGALKPGVNRIEIAFRSITQAANEAQAKQPFFVPYHAGNCPIPNGNMLRKPSCHFGWDWNIALAPFGLSGTIALRRLVSARIDAILVHQTHNADGSVDVAVDVDLTGKPGSGPVEYAITFNGETQRATEENDATQQSHHARFRVEHPKLWWPAGSGEQHLYDLEVRCGDDIAHRKIGLRTIELINEPDAAGARFGFRVNGREIFCRGANWIPADALPSRITPAAVEKLLTAARDGNMNMLRVWGGGYYESDTFYDLCDRLGLMVWQDAMFSCHLYPSTPDFLAEVDAELEYQAERLQHRASLALWCGDNELLGALTWFEESRKDRDRYLVSYDRLNRTVEAAIKRADPNANWWPSSPSPGLLNFGDAWHDDRSGDMHFWSVWHEGRDFEHYRDVKPRFCSEFGFQSYPSMATIRQFAEPADWNVSSPVFDLHQKNKGGNARIIETICRSFRFPKDFPNLVWLSQIQHGLAMRTAIDYWRSLKPHCMGTLYWQLNDTWPVASWSGLDHGGGWKALQHMAQQFFAPVRIVAIPEKGGFAVIGINDTPEEVSVAVRARVADASGKTSIIATFPARLPTNRSVTFGRLAAHAIPDGAVLLLDWTAKNGGPAAAGDIHAVAKPYKTLPLQASGLKLTAQERDGGLDLTLTAEALALYATVESPVGGHIHGNVVDVLPGEPRHLRFIPDNPADLIRARDALVVRDLYSSYAAPVLT